MALTQLMELARKAIAKPDPTPTQYSMLRASIELNAWREAMDPAKGMAMLRVCEAAKKLALSCVQEIDGAIVCTVCGSTAAALQFNHRGVNEGHNKGCEVAAAFTAIAALDKEMVDEKAHVQTLGRVQLRLALGCILPT